MRLKRKSYPSSVAVGAKSQRNKSGKINNLTPKLIHNLKELSSLNKESIGILAKIGVKKKLEIIKSAKEKNIRLLNVKGAQ